MIDIKFLRENPEVVKKNIESKFQDHKLPIVDEVIELDKKKRELLKEEETLRADRNKLSKEIGGLMAQGKKEEAEVIKEKVTKEAERLEALSIKVKGLDDKINNIMMVIPNIIDPSVPIGKNDEDNVEVQVYGDPFVPNFEIPYHAEIMDSFNGLDLDSARKVAGNGFYYLMGDIARLHSAVISYARDFMIDRGFTYCIPPYMIRSNVVTGVMSFAEMEAMMYKIEGEDLYLIGTSEHSMIGKFIDTIVPGDILPQTLTSYSPCFRKEKGAHGLEERGVYRIHQFEKQEMIVVCEPEDSPMWFDKLWQNTVDLFRTLDIPVRTLECCSGDLADLKVKSYDVEAWSPRQEKYFEVGSCSNLGDAQARRLKIRISNDKKEKYLAHTLNNTVVAPPRMLIAFLENNLQEDGSVKIPEALRPYMGGKDKIIVIDK
ncbi:MAG: serine--tRNA ligase [Eubacteriales bacterium]